jgi:2-haloacid dehalogenase
MAAPQAFAFDVMETLVSLEPQAKRLKEVGVTATPLEAVFVQALRDGIALAASGMFKPFAEVIRASVLSALATEQKAPQPRYDETAIVEFLAGFGTLPVHSDVEPALRLMADRGIPALFVTNGSRPTTEKIIQANGLTPLVRHIVSIDDVRAWKPLPPIYHHAAKVADVEPASLCMIAAHPWDCHGAKSAGLRAAFVRRKHPYYPPTMALPDAEADDLLSLVQALIG